MRDEDLIAAADRVAALAHRLADVVDLPTAVQLTQLADELSDLEAWVFVERGTALMRVVLANLGCPEDIADDLVRDQLYLDAEAKVRTVAERFDLPPADDLAIDVLVHYPHRVHLRAGHWAVSVAVVQDGNDLPLLVEADLSYGADLPGRLAQLAGPGRHGVPVDWDAATARIGFELPRDYRWLMEHYGPATFDGYLTLKAPDELSPPVFGPPSGPMPYAKFVIPVATTVDGAVVTWILSHFEWTDQWNLQVVRPGTVPWDFTVGLLQFLVVTLSGAYRVPQFPPEFPSSAPDGPVYDPLAARP